MRHELIRQARAGLLVAAATFGATTMGATFGAMPAMAQAADPAGVLTQNLRVLDRRPNDFNALIAAGNAAVDVGDLNAAAGLFARASDVASDRPEPQAGLGRVMANIGNPAPAMAYFTEAVRRGGDVTSFAVDRGLAKDLLGDTSGAQADYRLGLGRADDAKARRRLALSLAIDGERTAALAFLQPLINDGDPAARRVRAFVLALTGDLDGARNAIEREMPGSSTGLAPFLAKLPMISNAQKAAAVHLGMFPTDSEIRMAERPTRVATPTPPPPQRRQASTTRQQRQQADSDEVSETSRSTRVPVVDPLATDKMSLLDRRAVRRAERERLEAMNEAFEADEEEPVRAQPETAQVEQPVVVRQAAPVEQVAIAPSRSMELPSEVSRRETARVDSGTQRSGERLASIDQLLSQPAASSSPTAPPPSRPKFEARPQPKVEAPQPPPKPAPKPDIGTEGTWWVQLAGGSRRDGLAREWRRIQGEAGSLLSGHTPHSSDGVRYFRLLVGPFSSRDNAQELTNKLRGNGIDVFTYRRSPAQLKITPL